MILYLINEFVGNLSLMLFSVTFKIPDCHVRFH